MNIPEILIIDDEIEVCTLLKNYLQKKGKLVDFSTSLKEGFAKFESFKPNFLILDNNLPDGFGIEKISHFKEINPFVCIIMLSARSDLKREALEKGANFFLEKPISFSILNNILKRFPPEM